MTPIRLCCPTDAGTQLGGSQPHRGGLSTPPSPSLMVAGTHPPPSPPPPSQPRLWSWRQCPPSFPSTAFLSRITTAAAAAAAGSAHADTSAGRREIYRRPDCKQQRAAGTLLLTLVNSTQSASWYAPQSGSSSTAWLHSPSTAPPRCPPHAAPPICTQATASEVRRASHVKYRCRGRCGVSITQGQAEQHITGTT
jgi:hypothetical protein